ncbi:MAG: acyl-CoA thioesterase [Oscillospiraceae bacterium]|nr:acyl-CoA thioesterase [Oscillospiraceae bacterium]
MYTHKVHYYETDRMGITHHSNYIRWMEEARIEFLKNIGWGYEKIEEMGIISPVTAVECRYKNTTTFADIVHIDVWVEEFKGVRLKIGYSMKKPDGTLVCECSSEHCFMNKDGKIISLKREYPDIYNALVQHIKEE